MVYQIKSNQIKSNQMWIYIAHCQKISNALTFYLRLPFISYYKEIHIGVI